MSIDIDVGKIAEGLNNKADLDMNSTVGHLGTSAKEYFSAIGMPSSKYVNLTLGASGDTYTAPANGWFAMWGHYNSVEIYNNSGGNLYWGINGPSSTFKGVSCPAKKGDVAKIYYTTYGDNINFRFVYAEGVK